MVIALVAAVLVHTTARADDPGAAPAGVDATFWKQLVAIDARGAAVKDLTADFTQEKTMPLMKKPLVSAGTIKIKDNAALWHTTRPAPTVMRIDAKELRMYYPEQKAMEVYAVDQRMGPLAASPFPRLALLKPHFSFERIPARELQADADDAKLVGVKMRPINADLRKHIDEVSVLLEVDTGLARRARTVDPDGDKIVLTFSNMKPNAGLTERDVELNVPAGVTVTRPLEGGRAESSGGGGGVGGTGNK
jgi:outer membrane lipoprotein-sorting protein